MRFRWSIIASRTPLHCRRLSWRSRGPASFGATISAWLPRVKVRPSRSRWSSLWVTICSVGSPGPRPWRRACALSSLCFSLTSFLFPGGRRDPRRLCEDEGAFLSYAQQSMIYRAMTCTLRNSIWACEGLCSRCGCRMAHWCWYGYAMTTRVRRCHGIALSLGRTRAITRRQGGRVGFRPELMGSLLGVMGRRLPSATELTLTLNPNPKP